jgi:hypothetical protein
MRASRRVQRRTKLVRELIEERGRGEQR